jgi:hypothetical protein
MFMALARISDFAFIYFYAFVVGAIYLIFTPHVTANSPNKIKIQGAYTL